MNALASAIGRSCRADDGKTPKRVERVEFQSEIGTINRFNKHVKCEHVPKSKCGSSVPDISLFHSNSRLCSLKSSPARGQDS